MIRAIKFIFSTAAALTFVLEIAPNSSAQNKQMLDGVLNRISGYQRSVQLGEIRKQNNLREIAESSLRGTASDTRNAYTLFEQHVGKIQSFNHPLYQRMIAFGAQGGLQAAALSKTHSPHALFFHALSLNGPARLQALENAAFNGRLALAHFFLGHYRLNMRGRENSDLAEMHFQMAQKLAPKSDFAPLINLSRLDARDAKLD